MYKLNVSKSTSRGLMQSLLKNKVITLDPENPFTWASGMKSPIYCDNRETLSIPHLRNEIKNLFVTYVKEHFPDVEVIAGVSTGGIAQAALVADALTLPMVYVRAEVKGHGKGKLVEGKSVKGMKVVVIEDLISTGTSSLKVVDALRDEGAEVLGLGAIFTYEFQKAVNAFEEKLCKYFTLATYPELISLAIDAVYIQESQQEDLLKWYKDPSAWSQARGGS